ncbi:MAG: LytR C-terminal domain-containing protein [Patescibacteria group bacterium]
MIKKNKNTNASKKQISNDVEPQKQATKPFFLLAVIAIVLIAAAVLMFTNGLKKKEPAPDQTQIKEEQMKDVLNANDISQLIKRISELIEIKKDEEPTVATVQDADLLRSGNPEFYKNAENGDRLLVWSDKAVLYSVSKDKLLSVMQLQNQEMATTTAQNQPATEVSEDLATQYQMEAAKIDIKNGTRTAGIAGKMKSFLESKNITVNSVGDANLKDYEKTIIIKNTEENMPATEALLKQITGADISEAPAGESSISGDYTVIAGNDFIN